MKAVFFIVAVILAAPLGGADFESRMFHERKEAVSAKSHSPNAPEGTDAEILTEPERTSPTTEVFDTIPLGVWHKSIFHYVIGRDGRAKDFIIEKAAGYGVDEMCMQRVRRSTWKPATWHGVPSTTNFRSTCEFRMNP